LGLQQNFISNKPGSISKTLALRAFSIFVFLELLKFEQQKWITFEKRKTDQPDADCDINRNTSRLSFQLINLRTQ
jgi:hypothetical protein